MSKLSLYLLGAPRAESDGAPLVTDTRKAIALLAYLATTGMGHTRDAIATMLWPDLDQVRARAALRRTLSSINAAADADWMRAEREHVALVDAPSGNPAVWCDVRAFRAALAETRTHGRTVDRPCPRCLDALERAAALYRDDFMAGFSLRDSITFDDWQFFEAEGLRREFADTLERLVQLHTATRNWQPAILHARRRLSLDSLHEPAHRQLMLLYAWSGERAAAVRQYQVCADILARELDVPPLPDTVDLFQAIKDQREPAPPPPAMAQAIAGAMAIALPVPVMADSPAEEVALPLETSEQLLVGRGPELARLGEGWRAAAGKGRFMLLQGEAGIGKTALAENYLAGAQAEGAIVLAARCYEGEQDLTLTPFLHLLRAVFALPQGAKVLADLDTHWLQELRRLLPELPGAGGESLDLVDSAGAKARLFETVAHVLHNYLSARKSGRTDAGRADAGRADSGPGILFIDDVQWLDPASLDLLAYLVNRLQNYPMLLLATLRSGEAGGEARVLQILADAQRRHAGEAIEVTRLAEADVAELVANWLPERARRTPELAARLFAEAEGLAFFVVEYLAALERAEIDPDAPWQQPQSVRDLLRSRLSRIGEVEQQVLTTAAVVGRSFDFDTLRAASGRSEDETLQAIEELVARTLIRELEGELFDFTHEQLRAVVYESASLTRRRLLHRRVAETLVASERTRGREHEAARIAQHFEQAAQMAEAARYYFLAGGRAAEIRANSESLAFYRRAGTLGYPDRAELHSRMGDLRTLMGDYKEALQDYAVSVEITPAEGVGNEVARAHLFHRLARVHHRLGDYAAAEAEWRSGLRLLEGSEEHEFASWMLAELSLTIYRNGNRQGALTAARQALQEAEHSGSTDALAHAHTVSSHLYRLAGNGDEALANARSALLLAEQVDDLGLNVAALNSLALAHAALQPPAPAAAIPLLERALDLCRRQGDRHREAALHNNLADVYHLAGERAKAMQHLTEAVTIFAEIGSGQASANPEIWKLTEW